ATAKAAVAAKAALSRSRFEDDKCGGGRLARLHTKPCSVHSHGCFCGGRIDHRSHLGDAIRGESAARRVLANLILVLRDVHAVDPVIYDVALKPLDVRPHRVEKPARRSGDLL